MNFCKVLISHQHIQADLVFPAAIGIDLKARQPRYLTLLMDTFLMGTKGQALWTQRSISQCPQGAHHLLE